MTAFTRHLLLALAFAFSAGIASAAPKTITDFTETTAPADADELLLQEVGAGYKKVRVDNLRAGALPVDDTTAVVRDPADNTKLLRIDAGAIATGTTRVLTMPDQDVDLTPGATFQAPLPVDDTTAVVRDPVDNTKLMRIDAGAITTGTTRTVTMPDQDVDLTPGVTFAAAGAGTLPVDDTTAVVRDPVDNTKLVRIDAGAVATATTRVITMPDQDVDLTPGATYQAPVVLATEQAASGTSVTFGSIPAGTKKIMVQFVGVGSDGANHIGVRLGDSGGIETTGYLGSGSTFSTGNQTVTGATTEFLILATSTAVIHGSVVLTLEDEANNTWVASGVLAWSNSAVSGFTAGSKSLSGALTQIQITALGDNFDAGSFNIQYQ